MTNNFENFSQYEAYPGHDQVTVGIGTSLPIHHIGQGLLPTPTYSFHLNNLLHVPSISSNLLSVHQLTIDHNCIVIFNAHSFVV